LISKKKKKKNIASSTHLKIKKEILLI